MAKQVLGLAKQFAKTPGARQIIEDIDPSTLEPGAFDAEQGGVRPGQPNIEFGQDGGPTLAPGAFDAAEGGVQPGQDMALRLAGLGFNEQQIAQIMGSNTTTPVPMGQGRLTAGGRVEEGQIPMVGGEPAPILFQDPTGRFAPDPSLQALIDAGTLNAADVKSLADLGYGAVEIRDILTPIDAFGAGIEPGGGVGPMLAPGAFDAAEGGVQPQERGIGIGRVAGAASGAITIAQALSDEGDQTAAQRAVRGVGGAAQIGAAVAPSFEATAALTPYLAGVGSAANLVATAIDPDIPNDQKAASTAIDAAVIAASIAYPPAGMIFMGVGAAVKFNLQKSYGQPHPVREALEVRATGNMAQQLIKRIQGVTTTQADLYQLLRSWSTPLVGGASGDNAADQWHQGLDATAFNVFAKAQGGRPDWQYLGLYGGGGIDPNAPTPQQFFDRLMQNPEDFGVEVQAGIAPDYKTNINQAVLSNIREQVIELRAREQIRPNILAFSRMAGVYVSEDDVINALQNGRGVAIDSPEFAALMRQAERDRVSQTALTEAMANQPWLPQTAAQKPYLESLRAGGGDYGFGAAPDNPAEMYAYQQREAQHQQGFEGTQAAGYDPAPAPERTYQAAEAGYTFKPGQGWADEQGNIALAAPPLPAPEPWQEPTPAPQPASTATPPSSAAPVAGAIPMQFNPATGQYEAGGQSNIPATSPLAPPPEEQPNPIGIMDRGGVVPRTGLYQMQAGERVIPNPPRQMLAKHEQSETVQTPDGRWINVYGKNTPQAGQPLPYEGNSYDTVEEAVEAAERRSEEEGRPAYPDGRYYLDPKRGVPFPESSNSEPGRAWRLVFDPDELHDAWTNRAKDGAPLLVPPSILTRRDWPSVVERARRSQYMSVHPAVLLARQEPPHVLGAAHELGIDEEEQMRFEEALKPSYKRMAPGPVPRPEPTPPMRQMPPQRPLTPEDWKIIERGYPTEVAQGPQQEPDSFMGLLRDAGRDVSRARLSDWTKRPEDTETLGQLGRRALQPWVRPNPRDRGVRTRS